jgi:hypothetical protein
VIQGNPHKVFILYAASHHQGRVAAGPSTIHIGNSIEKQHDHVLVFPRNGTRKAVRSITRWLVDICTLIEEQAYNLLVPSSDSPKQRSSSVIPTSRRDIDRGILKKSFGGAFVVICNGKL